MILIKNQMNDTIVSIATANGVASIAIVRLSGKDALKIANLIAPNTKITPRYAHLSSLYDNNRTVIDQAILIYFNSPNSFTGEDVVEFQTHGGIVVASLIIELALSYGARIAEAGEYSKRAFLNGKIDLTQAEAIAKLIEAKSVDAAKILARQLKGSLAKFVDESREILLAALAHSEVMIDYAEEDLPLDITDGIISKLNNLSSIIDNLISSSLRRKGLIDGFRVAIVGKPNAGKSSLLNAILSYDRAIVSDIAGTTRDTIEEQVRIGTHVIRLIDTAGIRDASDEIEKIGVSRSINSLNDADIIIALFDSSRDWDTEDDEIVKLLQSKSVSGHIIIALNKVDLARKIKNDFLDSNTYIEVSAKENFISLTNAIEGLLNDICSGEELMLVSSRQISAVSLAKCAIEESKQPLLNGKLEIFSYHLLDAIRSISSISRPYDNDEILDKMFSEFCLGK